MSAADALGRCRSIIGGEFDAFGAEWRAMTIQEREFWLRYARISIKFSVHAWEKVPGAERALIKNTIRRCADRAKVRAAAC